jgi:integrase
MKLQSDRYTTGEKALTREEYDKLVKGITDLQDEPMIRLGVATGLRREDLCNLECDNINLKDKTMLFYESKYSIIWIGRPLGVTLPPINQPNKSWN